MFYGEDEPEGRFLSDACRKMMRGERLFLTEGTQKRDIIYIEDVYDAIILLLQKVEKGFWNVPLGSGEAVPVRLLMEYMRHATGSVSKLDFGAVPVRINEPDCVADMSLLKNMGFQLKYPWKHGIDYLCQQMKKLYR